MDRNKINRMFAVPHTFIADEARQAGAADSCQLPGTTTCFQWSMDAHHGTLLFVSQCDMYQSFM